MLPGWYGFGAAVAAAGREVPDAMARLRRLHAGSRFFRSVIANLEMVLAKSSLTIARRYAGLLEDRELAARIFGRISAEWEATHAAVLAITGEETLLAHDPRLAQSIRMRLPYIDTLNILQVELLRRHRAGAADEGVRRSIHMSINGISAGLRNSG
jgi:phosphoenolpyruvate carboxylase